MTQIALERSICPAFELFEQRAVLRGVRLRHDPDRNTQPSSQYCSIWAGERRLGIDPHKSSAVGPRGAAPCLAYGEAMAPPTGILLIQRIGHNSIASGCRGSATGTH
jgi:hypothetical protein